MNLELKNSGKESDDGLPNSLPTRFTVIGIVEKLMMIPDSMPRAFM